MAYRHVSSIHGIGCSWGYACELLSRPGFVRGGVGTAINLASDVCHSRCFPEHTSQATFRSRPGAVSDGTRFERHCQLRFGLLTDTCGRWFARSCYRLLQHFRIEFQPVGISIGRIADHIERRSWRPWRCNSRVSCPLVLFLVAVGCLGDFRDRGCDVLHCEFMWATPGPGACYQCRGPCRHRCAWRRRLRNFSACRARNLLRLLRHVQAAQEEWRSCRAMSASSFVPHMLRQAVSAGQLGVSPCNVVGSIISVRNASWTKNRYDFSRRMQLQMFSHAVCQNNRQQPWLDLLKLHN